MEIVLLLLSLYLGGALISARRARRREEERRIAVSRQGVAFARAMLALEWTGGARARQANAGAGREPFVAPRASTARSPMQDGATAPPDGMGEGGARQGAVELEPPASDTHVREVSPEMLRAQPPVEALLVDEGIPAARPASPSRAAGVVRPRRAPARGSEAELRVAVQRYSAWREHVRPFLVENIGWFVGGFLVVAGSLYFLREAWSSFARLGRQMLIVATTLAYAGGFVGVALWLKRKHGLPTASRAMAYVGLALLPVAALAASITFEMRVWAWALAGPGAVLFAYPFLYLAAGILDRLLAAPLARSLAALLALVVLAPAVAAASPQAALVLPYLGWAILHVASAVPLRGRETPSSAVLAFHLSALAYALLFVIGRSHALGGATLPFPAFYGPLAVLASFTALRVDVELRARWGRRPEIDTAVVASFAAALAGIALAIRHPTYLALSAALGAAHFAAGIAWYRRPLLLYFSLASTTASVVALIASSRIVRAGADAAAALMRGGDATSADMLCIAALGVIAIAASADRLEVRFRAREEPRLALAARSSAALLVLLGAGGALSAAAIGSRAAPAAVFAAVAILLALWHRREPRAETACGGAAAVFGAVTLAASSAGATPGFALATAAVVLALAAASALRGTGERPGASALLHGSLLAAGLALFAGVATGGGSWRGHTALVAVLWTAGAVLIGNVTLGAVGSGAGLLLLATLLGGPAVFRSWPSADLRWVALPACALATSFALRVAARGWRGPRPLATPLPRGMPGLVAVADPLVGWSSVATLLLAVRGAVSVDSAGALLLASSGACALALAAFSRDARWTATAAGLAVMAGAWQGAALLGLRGAPLGGALAAAVLLASARALRQRAGPNAEAAIDLCTVALGAITVIAFASAVDALGSAPAASLRLPWFALCVCAAASIALAAPLRRSAGFVALGALPAAVGLAPLVLGWPPTAVAPALAALALVLLWVGELSGRPEWAAPVLDLGPHLVAGVAFVWGLARPGQYLRWDLALSDALLAAYLGSALAIEGSVVFVHLLVIVAALGAMRVRALLGIVPTGWGLLLAGTALLGVAIAIRRRAQHASALLFWSALSLALTCASALGTPFVRGDRWPQMAVAALVAVPLAAHYYPVVTSFAAVGALAVALLGAIPAVAPALWTWATWPLVPAAVALLFALAARAVERLRESLFCSPGALARALRLATIILALVPAGLASYGVLAASMRLPGVPAGGPGWMAAVPLLLGGGALALVGGPLRSAWPLSVAACLAFAAAVLPLKPAWIPGGGALIFLAEAAALAALARSVNGLPPIALALWCAALAGTHLSAGEWTTAVVVLAGAWFAREAPRPFGLSPLTGVLLAAAGFALAWAGTRSAVFASAGVAAPLGLLAVAGAVVHERRRGQDPNASVLICAASLLLVAGGLAGSPRAHAPFLVGGAALLGVVFAWRARTDSRWVYVAALPVLAAYAWFRIALGILAGWPSADATVALAAAFGLAIAQAALRESPLSRPLAHLSAGLPVVLFVVAPSDSVVVCAGAAAVLYGLLGWIRHSRLAAYAAVALVNLALFASWRDRGLTDLQLYTVPLGLSLLASAQISHGDLSRRNLSRLRALGCLVLYAGTAVQMLRFEGVTYPLALGGLALATVTAGIALQIRAFALLGTATLVADVLANLVRASAHSSRVMAISATGTGFAILGAMIWLSVKREETLALYRRLVQAMDDWE